MWHTVLSNVMAVNSLDAYSPSNSQGHKTLKLYEVP